MAGNGLKWLEMVGNGWKLGDMTGNCKTWLNILLEMTENSWKCLDTDWKWLIMTGNGCKVL